ncbi:MAG: gas vesicle protein GvpG [Candidatus Brocadiia bacterium]
MFLIDNVLLAPVSGVMYVFREIRAAAQAEAAKNADALRAQLAELYGMLEAGRISSEQFDAKEKELLDRLDEISRVSEGDNDE